MSITRIKEIDTLIEKRRSLISSLSDEILALESERTQIKSGLVIGQNVRYKGNLFRVSGFTNYWVLGQKLKSDGTPSKISQNLYSEWSKP